MSRQYLFTSESVTEGHPDKVCDQISDAILDEILGKDPDARVACETMVTTGLVVVAGEISTKCYVDIPYIVRKTLKGIGYTRAKYGFDSETCAVITTIDEQSPDIAVGVNKAFEIRHGVNGNDKSLIGAGDQGMMFGYATNETPEFMPLPITLAHRLVMKLSEVRKDGSIPYLKPDGKSQVTVEYHNNKPVRVEAVVIAAQHKADIEYNRIKKDIDEKVIKTVVPEDLIDENTKIYINPTGRFVVGGPQGDTGVTGRKIIVDTYGGMGRHGGGALSGKDPTKVDRSSAYMARYVAKNIVAAGLADKCELQIAYAIGKAYPVSVTVDTFGTSKISEQEIERIVNEVFDLRPAAIMEKLDLKKPIYKKLAAYGHFGRPDLDLTWEKLDKVEILKQKAGL
ncbi:MAG TPA: methionine adenosyltransferase [Thermoanaerobacterales bacterium]|nr:methionine adenosyltransferase [Thermoanaerobacterales bacterium]